MARKSPILTFAVLLFLFIPQCFGGPVEDYFQAETLRKNRQNRQAEIIYKKIAAENQGSDYELLAYVRLAEFYISGEREELAEQMLAKAIANFSDNELTARLAEKMAYCYRRSGKYERSIELNLWVLDNWGNSVYAVDSQAGLAISLIKNKDFEQAQAEAEELKTLYTGNDRQAKQVIAVGDAYRDKGEHISAFELYAWVVDNAAEIEWSIAAQTSIVKLNIALDEFGRAQTETDKLISRFTDNPGLAKAVDNIADSWREIDHYDKARELYRWAAAKFPTEEHSINSQASAAKACISMDDDAAATSEIATLLNTFGDNPGIAGAVQSVADEYFKKSRYDKALELYSQAVNSWPASADAVEALIGVIKSNIALEDEAGEKEGLNRLIVDFADNARLGEAIERIAGYYRARKEDDKAYEVSTYFSQWTSGSAAMGAQIALAKSYIAAGDVNNTETAINKLIADYNDLPSFAESAFDVATKCFYQANYRQAVRIWELVFEKDNLLFRHKEEIPYLLATCYRKLEEYPMAIDNYIKVVNHYRMSPYGYRAAFELGFLYTDLENYEQAIYWFEQQRKMFPSMKTAHVALSKIGDIYFFNIKDYQKAALIYEQCLESPPERASMDWQMYNLANCYEKLGDKSKAVGLLEDVLRLYPGGRLESAIKENIAKLREENQ